MAMEGLPVCWDEKNSATFTIPLRSSRLSYPILLRCYVALSVDIFMYSSRHVEPNHTQARTLGPNYSLGGPGVATYLGLLGGSWDLVSRVISTLIGL